MHFGASPLSKAQINCGCFVATEVIFFSWSVVFDGKVYCTKSLTNLHQNLMQKNCQFQSKLAWSWDFFFCLRDAVVYLWQCRNAWCFCNSRVALLCPFCVGTVAVNRR